MHISSFVNKPDDVSPHSNEYGAGTIASRTFKQRQAIEDSRQTIQGYQYSRLGANFQDRTTKTHIPKRPSSTQHAINSDGVTTTRQQTNARPAAQSPTRTPHHFQEPPSRGYNPYS